MATPDSPAVARRRVRLAIRNARATKELTQSDVANAMDWSLSKVMRIEKGEVNVGASDLKLLLAYLDVTDAATVQGLIADARLARQERWTADAQEREHLTPALIELIQYEAAATTVRYFQNLILPGILQTASYAQAIFDVYQDQLDPETIAARIESRMRRRQEVLFRAIPPDYLVVLDESVLRRPVGGPAVFAAQLDDLAGLIGHTTVRVRILSFEAGGRVLPSYGPFALYSLDDQDALLYREVHAIDEVVRASRSIDVHRARFEQVWDGALDEAASLKMIKECASAMRSG